MIRERKWTKLMLLAILVLCVGLMGCDSAAQTATPAPAAAPTVEATATPAPADAPVTTVLAAEATATPAPAGAPAPTAPASDPTATTATAPANTATSADPAPAAACTLLNLNTATADQLTATIPGFNSRWVREFLEYRPYVSIQQFRRELGKYTDQAQITEWETYVFVPVTPNDADAETLKQLPGVDDTIAAALISGRPYATNAAFLQALGAQVSPDQLAAASCYLAAATQ